LLQLAHTAARIAPLHLTAGDMGVDGFAERTVGFQQRAVLREEKIECILLFHEPQQSYVGAAGRSIGAPLKRIFRAST
jgi:hypothetical protein